MWFLIVVPHMFVIVGRDQVTLIPRCLIVSPVDVENSGRVGLKGFIICIFWLIVCIMLHHHHQHRVSHTNQQKISLNLGDTQGSLKLNYFAVILMTPYFNTRRKTISGMTKT